MRYFNSLADCTRDVVEDMTSYLGRTIEKHGKASLAVSGGRTPKYIFPLLSKASLPWAKITLTLADERWVASDHIDSNEGLARRLLMQGAAAQAQFIGLKSNHDDPLLGQQTIESSLAGLAWPLDAIYLGMGEDGHIASLFPGGDWETCDGRCVGVSATSSRQARMSLTPSALLEARKIYLVISGSEKCTVLERALQPGPVSKLPVRIILHQDEVPVEIFAVA